MKVDGNKYRRKSKLLYKRPEDDRKNGLQYPEEVVAVIFIENGCSFDEDEYKINISSKNFDLDNFDALIDAIHELSEYLDTIPKETNIEIDLIEDGEWEDVFWNTYFTIQSIRSVNYTEVKK